jgi:hypothetical protein
MFQGKFFNIREHNQQISAASFLQPILLEHQNLVLPL